MRVHPVLVDALKEGEETLRGTEARHLVRVLRVRSGSPLRAFDGSGLEADATVLQVRGDTVVVRLGPARPGVAEPKRDLDHSGCAANRGPASRRGPYGDRDWGQRVFRFIISERSQQGLVTGRLRRLERVAQEASKQAGRSVVPVIHALCRLAELPCEGAMLVAHPDTAYTLREARAALEAERLTVVTGPSGWSNAEVEALVARGATLVTLGPRILRATAPPTALAVAVLLAEGW